MIAIGVAIFVLVCGGIAFWTALRRRGVDRCVLPYIAQFGQRRSHDESQPLHVLLCIADHFEPQWGNPSPTIARDRVRAWVDNYPKHFGDFRDADGRAPRHTFFFPIDQYDDDHVTELSRLCRAGFGEVEIHLHHDHDTSENLRKTLNHYRLLLSERHGLLSRRRGSGEVSYGFVHGNWALDNSRPDGRWCGVNDELDVLRETGCYADFTFPSAPSRTQPRTINSIYFAADDPTQPKSHDRGIAVGTKPAPANSLMLIQGPLLPDWRRGKLENACLQASQPPSMRRLDLWIRANVHVPQRPDWRFVKLHTHGAPEANQRVLLGDAMVNFHRNLRQRSDANPNFHFHYVTAREIYNLAKAAADGFTGSAFEALDYELIATSAWKSQLTRPA